MNCICGLELTGKQRFCSDKCRKQSSRTMNSDKSNAPKPIIRHEVGQVGHNVPSELGQSATRTEEVGQIDVNSDTISGKVQVGQLNSDKLYNFAIDEIVRMPLAQAKVILREWAEDKGTTYQSVLGNLAIDYDIVKHHHPISELIPREVEKLEPIEQIGHRPQ